MKLTLAMIAAIVLCAGSLAARSRALRAVQVPSPVLEASPGEQVVLAAVDGHLRVKLQKLARR